MDKARGKGKASRRRPDIKKIAIVVVAASIIIYFAYALITQQISINKKNAEIKSLESQVYEAENESERLKKELDDLQNPEYIEKIARERLGLVRPNERVFVDSNKSEDNK